MVTATHHNEVLQRLPAFPRDPSISRSRPHDSRVNLADCCHNILDVRLGELRIERDPGKATMDCNRPGTALCAVSDRLASFAGEGWPVRVGCQLVLHGRLNGEESNAKWSAPRHVLGCHRLEKAVALIHGSKTQPDVRADLALGVRPVAKMQARAGRRSLRRPGERAPAGQPRSSRACGAGPAARLR